MADLKSMKMSDKDRKLIEDAGSYSAPNRRRWGSSRTCSGATSHGLVFPYPIPEAKGPPTAISFWPDSMSTCGTPVGPDRPGAGNPAGHRPAVRAGRDGYDHPKEFGAWESGMPATTACWRHRVFVRQHRGAVSHSSRSGARRSCSSGREQKKKWLLHFARTGSAFCLSEPNVGCDAGGQETVIAKRP